MLLPVKIAHSRVGRKKLSSMSLISTKLTPLTAELTSALLSSLSLPSNRKSTVVSLISLLVRLQAGHAARNTFLKMRSQVMKNHMRKIRFEGHIGAYIGDLAVVYFTGIKHTADWFLASFKENEVASGENSLVTDSILLLTSATAFIDWAKNEIHNYAHMFRKQVYSADVEDKVVEEAKNITYAQSKKVCVSFPSERLGHDTIPSN